MSLINFADFTEARNIATERREVRRALASSDHTDPWESIQIGPPATVVPLRAARQGRAPSTAAAGDALGSWRVVRARRAAAEGSMRDA
jgi:hypothetical protein